MSEPETTPVDEQPARRGFQIGDRFYPLISNRDRTVTDPALVFDVTGLTWDQFLDGLGYADPDRPSDYVADVVDPALVMAGLIAQSVAHGNPGWPRHMTVRYLSNLKETAVEVIGLDETPTDAQEAAGGPPTGEPEPTTTASGAPTPDATLEPSDEPQG